MKSNILRRGPLRLTNALGGYTTIISPSSRSSYVHEFIKQIIIVNTTESPQFVSLWVSFTDPTTPPVVGQTIYNRLLGPLETANIFYSPEFRLYTGSQYLIGATIDDDTVTLTVLYEQMLLDLYYID